MFTIYKMYMYKNVYRYNWFFPVSPSFYFSYIISGECLSDCCLTPTQQFFLAISWQEQVNFRRNDDEVRFVLDQQSRIDMSPHLDTLS